MQSLDVYQLLIWCLDYLAALTQQIVDAQVTTSCEAFELIMGVGFLNGLKVGRPDWGSQVG